MFATSMIDADLQVDAHTFSHAGAGRNATGRAKRMTVENNPVLQFRQEQKRGEPLKHRGKNGFRQLNVRTHTHVGKINKMLTLIIYC